MTHYSTQIFIIYHELEHFKICLDTVTDVNKTLNIVTGDNSDAVIDLGYEKNFQNGITAYDNESLYIPIVLTLSEESANPMIADEDAVDHILKKTPKCDIIHDCAHGVAART